MNTHRTQNTIIQKIEKNGKKIINQYDKIFNSFLNLNIKNQKLVSYFKKK